MKFKVGDRVKCISNEYPIEKYKDKTGVVKKITACGPDVMLDDNTMIYVCDNELKKIETSPTFFEVGDRVIFVSDDVPSRSYKGRKGTIEKILPVGIIVKVDVLGDKVYVCKYELKKLGANRVRASSKKKYLQDAIDVINERVRLLEDELASDYGQRQSKEMQAHDRAAISEAKYLAMLIDGLKKEPYTKTTMYKIAKKNMW